MNKYDDLMNSLTDSDWGWLPFVFLKPSKTTVMTDSFVLKISFFYAPLFVVIFNIYDYFVEGAEINTGSFLLSLVFFTFLFFITYKFTFAASWNRRVKYLK